jgi:dipeptidyl aminopeptidase/acylaminoacyl peptidase
VTAAFPPSLSSALFHSHGHKLLGGLYLGAGEGLRATVLLLHGVPGVEKNLDIAYALRDGGWNCLYFHYRGCWGSQGDYDLGGLVDDVRAAADWLTRHPAVDGQRLALVGNSLGGYATLAAGAADPRFKALVPICPLVDPIAAPLSDSDAADYASMVNGVSPKQLQVQWAGLTPIRALAPRLAGRPILLVTAERDEHFPPEHYRSLLAALPNLTRHQIGGADHSFSAQRRELVSTVVGWLREQI